MNRDSIYRTKEGKEQSLRLYDEQMKKIDCEFHDLYITTRFGKTHVVETGNLEGNPLLVFHGGNTTTSYNLIMCRFLLPHFHIYAVDTIGHPGKSAEVSLAANTYDYGDWASDVITELGFEKMCCFGGSFGGGILAKLMCVAPEKVEKAVLIVPSGIHNAIPVNLIKMLIPLIMYRITKKEKYLKKTALFLSIKEEVLDQDTLDTIKDSFDHVKTKVGMPSDISAFLIKKCMAPTLVMAGEKDCMFPARKVLPRAKKIIPDCKIHMLKGCGHIHIMPEREKKIIIDFLK